MNKPVLFGVDVAVRKPDMLRGSIGLVTNDAAKTGSSRQHTRAALLQAGIKIKRLFSPEHGIGATAPDGHAVKNAADPVTGLPVISLYGERMQPSPEALADLDAVVFDIPQIGARFYTYIWTLWHILESCAAAKLPLIVLDRPNPVGGDIEYAEGPMLDVRRFGSFLGRSNIPIRHCLTSGELATLWNSEAKTKADLQVVRCEGWLRNQHWPETGLEFERTSPAIPSYLSALFYPGTCLFEATNLSLGRGTEYPFQLIGAPWLDTEQVTHLVNVANDGVWQTESCELVPTQQPWAGQLCRCVRLHVVQPKRLRPVALGLTLLAAVTAVHREQFRWATYPTAANPTGEYHFERLIGQAGIREFLDSPPSRAVEQIPEWTEAAGWTKRAQNALLYA